MTLSSQNNFRPLSGSKILTVIFFLLAMYVVLNGNWHRTKYPIQMDANGYYIFLPATFIYHDLKNLQFVHSMPEQFDRKYFLYPNISGGYLSKYAPGIALLQLPFFLTAHILAPVFQQEQSGYSPPYRLAVALSTLFYTFLSILILRRLLLRYFNDATATLSLIFVALGTNAFFYGILQAGLAHNYLLFAFSLMLLCLDSWWKSGHWYLFAGASATVGLMACIRPTEALTGLIPVGFLLQRLRESKFSLPASLLKSILAGIPAFLLLLIPLFLYWKTSTGNWIAYTYEQEGFYFDRPAQIWYGLFGFRKGWFIYTPMAALAFAGLAFIRKNSWFRPYFLALLSYLPLNIFIVLSWYCWWYGGCFGQRAFIPVLALLSIPLAAVLDYLRKKSPLYLLLPVFLLVLNIFQSFQYQRQILHMDAMTWNSYTFIFGKWRFTEEEKARMKTMLDYPDYSQRGKKLDEYFR